MHYHFTEIEKKWQQYWEKNKTFSAKNPASGGHSDLPPKFYVLDMFPYPSGSGLHVGHPLGYIATDIYSRYKRHKGFNVLHPMGFDAFGLPAEQYAIQTGEHPAISTEQNIERYKKQLIQLGLSFDWDREVRTCDPEYYKWTQWIFLQLYHSWYNNRSGKAENIKTLIQSFEINGNRSMDGCCSHIDPFSASDWKKMAEKEQQLILLNYRLAYLSETMVNWCPGLGTVLANEEVVDGVSERGGFPVERKRMKQWQLRITAYADRLLHDLDKIDWPVPIKEMQRNWIGRSTGALIHFPVSGHTDTLEIFTTRPDTLFGVTFMVLAPEHPLVEKITTEKYRSGVTDYVHHALNRLERDRLAGAGKVTGKFTGAYCIHPFTGKMVQIWVSDYVLSGYGTGAIMAVPAHDSRDFAFAKHLNIPIKKVIRCSGEDPECYEGNEGILLNSDFINGLKVPDAIHRIIEELERTGKGKRKVNYRLRDAVFSRQRYWGEPFPIFYQDDVPVPLPDDRLPLCLPAVDKYLPTETGDPPLARARDWKPSGGQHYEYNTMPGWAGSSWYYLRYEDPHNRKEFVSDDAVRYWQNIDLYMGGAEHATGHLLYVRFWTKFLHDLGYLPFDEPAKKLINQGMILGEDGEKMSKSRGNVINPDDVIAEYGADTFRLYEMFLGPLEQAKPWDTRSIEGVHRFLKKVWRLCHSLNDKGEFYCTDEKSTPDEQKIIHRTIKKVQDDIEHFALNTAISALMVCVNELTERKCAKKEILEPLTLLLSPFAPHLAEELWEKLGHTKSVICESFPEYSQEYLTENTIKYPVQFNGKLRFTLELPADYSSSQIEQAILSSDQAQKYLDGKSCKKVIVVPGKIVNVVV